MVLKFSARFSILFDRIIPGHKFLIHHLGCCSHLYHQSWVASMFIIHHSRMYAMLFQSCLTICNPVYCSLPGSSVHEESPGKCTEVICHALLQGIFLTHELNSLLMSPA